MIRTLIRHVGHALYAHISEPPRFLLYLVLIFLYIFIMWVSGAHLWGTPPGE